MTKKAQDQFNPEHSNETQGERGRWTPASFSWLLESGNRRLKLNPGSTVYTIQPSVRPFETCLQSLRAAITLQASVESSWLASLPLEMGLASAS